VAGEVAFRAAVNGNSSCVFFKSVGLNAALDTVVQFSLMNIIGGLVIVVGDDPGANSSQNEQDNRHIYHMALTGGAISFQCRHCYFSWQCCIESGPFYLFHPAAGYQGS
jgi:hypothetical protein